MIECHVCKNDRTVCSCGKVPLYRAIAGAIQAARNADAAGNSEWEVKHDRRAHDLVRRHMPSGAGIDSGTSLLDTSTPERLVFLADYHHMSEQGYTGWTEHTVIVTPSLTAGFELRITGRNRNDVKDYLAEVYDDALRAVVDEFYPDMPARERR